MNITINNVTYDVGIAQVKRSYRREYKYQVMTEDGVTHTDCRATYVDFDLSLGNIDPTDYDSLMAALLAATGDVTIVMPKGAATTETYTGIVEGISDGVLVDYGSSGVLWDGLNVSFTATNPVTTGGGA